MLKDIDFYIGGLLEKPPIRRSRRSTRPKGPTRDLEENRRKKKGKKPKGQKKRKKKDRKKKRRPRKETDEVGT